jgi:mRNA interferase RelE/StbE
LVWKIKWDRQAVKELKRLDISACKMIDRYLGERIATNENPRRFGKALTEDKRGLWRYRVADYRIICKIEDETVTVLVVAVGHRKEVYQ